MSGFEKIDIGNINQKINEQNIGKFSMTRKRLKLRKISRKDAGIIVGILLIISIFTVFGLILPASRVLASARVAYYQARIMTTAFKQQNVDLAASELNKTKTALANTQKHMRSLSYLRFVPVVNIYYNDADHLLKAGEEGLKTAEIVITSLQPYADVLGLKGQGSFVGGSAEERIKTAVLTMGKITPKIDEISDSLQIIRKEIDGIDPNHYPEIIFGKKIKSELTKMRKLTDQGVELVNEARPLIKVLPSLLGESEPKKYLVLFQNDKELRPTGGFITAYAIFTLDKGIIKLERQDDIYNLDNSIPNKPKAPPPILKYLPKVTTFNLRDSNLSPDFVESMKTFEKFYNQASQKTDIDGIIAIDTHVLVSTIKILDDQITVNGQTYTTKPDDRCGGCPQVIYELEDNISRPVNYVRTDRKGLLGDMLVALMQKSLSSSPKIYWGPLFQSMLTQTHQKHILFYLYDQDAQSGIEALKAAGKILPFEGDYFHLNEANFAGAKSNLFVDQTVEMEYEIQKDGTIVKTVTINYKNPHPPSDCNLERGGLCLNAELRDWFRIYVPKGSHLRNSKGSEVKITTYEELGKTVFEGFLTVRPRGATKLVVSYELPFKLAKESPLPLLIQKQPGTYGPLYKIKINGKLVEKFELLTDQEIKLKI
ncbi:MAG: hypothetical protein KatS3mg083_603 [Candidatus Dojkabacteria bacterium]|nr:MAG: hypothetical protein KatS3mg083_603 [Candidatus Dojkabacteria bacterium]GIW61574.1 MAG: hypothetical protein KatS3mg089_0426 [Patescibacteria group bacterium]